MAAQPQEVPAAAAQGNGAKQAAAAQAYREIMEEMEAETQPAAAVVGQELQEQMQAVLTEEPEETGFNIIYQELTLFTPVVVVVAAVATIAAPAEQAAPAAAAMEEITEEESEEVMESRIQAAAAAERGHMLMNRALTAAQAL